RADTSGAKIRIYTLGLGDLLNQNGGSVPETGASILMRIANDPASPSFNPSQAEGKYYFAGDTSQLVSAFEAIRNQIIRQSQRRRCAKRRPDTNPSEGPMAPSEPASGVEFALALLTAVETSGAIRAHAAHPNPTPTATKTRATTTTTTTRATTTTTTTRPT